MTNNINTQVNGDCDRQCRWHYKCERTANYSDARNQTLSYLTVFNASLALYFCDVIDVLCTMDAVLTTNWNIVTESKSDSFQDQDRLTSTSSCD